jgi:arylsulfatase A-like enzyme
MRAALLVSLALLGCSTGGAAPDVIVIVLDTLRTDRTTVFDAARDTTPFLAELAARSVVFENAWSTSSWTAPAVASIFTGTYPSQHGVDIGIWLFERLRDSRPELHLKRIPDELETLPEMLRERGYATFGIADNPNISRAEGFSRGFDRFASADYRGGAEVNALLAGWAPAIRSADPAFVYLHYMDAHWPYHEHAEHYRAPAEQTERAREIARYDAELRYLDTRLREAFELLAPTDDAVVVVVSDHGEELYERGSAMENRQHGFQLYDELARVLLLIHDPARAPGGARVRAPASLVDLLPTIRDRVGIGPGDQAAGHSWLAHYANGARPHAERALFAMRREVAGSDRRMRAVVRDGWKYIRTEPAPGRDESVREELYDLRGDGGERVDRAASEPERRAAMYQQWLAFERAAPRWEPAAATLELSPGQAERLRTLGYADESAGADAGGP